MSEAPIQPCRPVWGKRIERVFLGTPSRRSVQRVRRHAAGCERCRAAYDRLAHAERALYASEFPRPAIERVAALGLGTAARKGRTWAGAGALATAAAAVLLWFVTSPPTVPKGEFRARGANPTFESLAPGEREPGVRLFCVEVSDSGAKVTDEVHMARATMPPPELTCRIGDELQVAYSTPNLPGLTMTVVGHSPFGARYWYAPPDGGSPPVPLAADVIDEPLTWSTRLAAEHEPGVHDVVARFFVGSAPASPAASSGSGHAASELRARLVVEPGEEEAL